MTFSNCVIYGSSRAIGVYTFQGGTIENIQFLNIVAETNAPLVLNRPIHIGVWDNEGNEKKGTIRNLLFPGFKATTQGCILITAAIGHILENITLRDVSLEYPDVENPSQYAAGITSAQLKVFRAGQKQHNQRLLQRMFVTFKFITSMCIFHY